MITSCKRRNPLVACRRYTSLAAASRSCTTSVSSNERIEEFIPQFMLLDIKLSTAAFFPTCLAGELGEPAVANPASAGEQQIVPITGNRTISFNIIKEIGHGSFGAVFLAKLAETGEVVAIKKVLQDRRFKNRELQIMRMVRSTPPT